MRTCVVVACLVAAPGMASAAPPPPSQRIPTVTRLVQLFSGLESDWMEAVRRQDEAAVARALADGFEMRSALRPGDPVPAAEWAHGAAHEFRLRAFRISQMAVRELGSIALVSFRLDQEGELGGRDESGAFLIVDAWVQQEGAWKVAARYSDAPALRRPLGAPATSETIPKKD